MKVYARFDKDCSRLGAIGFPEPVLSPVKGRKIERAVEFNQRIDRFPGMSGALRSRVDVLHHHGPGGSAVGFPEFGAMGAITGPEEQLAVEFHEGVRTGG